VPNLFTPNKTVEESLNGLHSYVDTILLQVDEIDLTEAQNKV